MDVVESIENIKKDVRKCQQSQKCDSMDTRIYTGEFWGDASDRRVMFVGESPSGRPQSVGRIQCKYFKPGENINFNYTKADCDFHRMRDKHGFLNTYLTDMVKCGRRCKPKNNKEWILMLRKCLSNGCIDFIRREIEAINPKVIVTLGDNASALMKVYLPEYQQKFHYVYHYTNRFLKGNTDKAKKMRDKYEKQYTELRNKVFL